MSASSWTVPAADAIELVEVRPLPVEVGREVGHQVAHRVRVDGVEGLLQLLEHLVGRDRHRRVALGDGGPRREVGPAGVARVQVDVGGTEQLGRDERGEGAGGDLGPLVHRQRDVHLVAHVLHLGHRPHLDAEDVDGGAREETRRARIDDVERVGRRSLGDLDRGEDARHDDHAGQREPDGLRGHDAPERRHHPAPCRSGATNWDSAPRPELGPTAVFGDPDAASRR